MAKWFSKSVCQVVEDINNDVFVLPVIQRKLVWDFEQMELLFDSILKKNAFGGIMVLECEQNRKPLFDFRLFSKKGGISTSHGADEILGAPKFMVIDGQQRLQTLLIGLKGEYEGKSLYFNLLSESEFYEFQFAYRKSELPTDEVDDTTIATRNIWYSAANIYSMFLGIRENEDPIDIVTKNIISSELIQDNFESMQVRENIATFYNTMFKESDSVGFAKVNFDREQIDDDSNKEKLVELFIRLNNGGTILSAFDLIASQFKSFEPQMEGFFGRIDEFSYLGIDQDKLINLLFILQDIPIKDPSRRITNPYDSDAKFAIQNENKILEAIYITKQFLQLIKLEEYIKHTKSMMPLYFVIYHLFHSAKPGDIIDQEGSQTKHNLERWLLLVYLNSVYQSGRRVGWRANTTGIKLTLACLYKYKNSIFPCEQLFEVYRSHNLRFLESIDINNLQSLNIDFFFFLLNKNKKYVRTNDIDHIQPRSKLANFEYEKINHLANFQLLGIEENRGGKSDLTLEEWINTLGDDKDKWIQENLIPENQTTWKLENYESFLTERTKLINQAINNMIPNKLVDIEIPITSDEILQESIQSTPSNKDLRWENKLKLANQYGYGVLFEELHETAINAKMWITAREKAIQYHHNWSGTRVLMTLYLNQNGIWVILRLEHFPEFYRNSGQFIASVKDGGQFVKIPNLPSFIEKIRGLESKKA